LPSPMNTQHTRSHLCDPQSMRGKRKVLSLLRVSSIQQADPEKDGIPRQLRHIAEHCKKFDLHVVTEYRLDGISGAKVQYNPQFKSMIRRLTEPDIAGVVFSRMDRFFRPEHLDAYEIFKTFRKEKKLLFCDLASDDGLDVANPQDQMKIQLWGMVAAQERRNIAERNREGKEASRRKEDRKSDPLPVGVTWDETTGLFAYDPEYGKKVREAFKLVLAGSTLSAVVLKLGFTSQTGLRKILRNQWWIGNKTHLMKREYRDESDTVGRKVPLKSPVIVPTNLAKKPLINPVDFERVQRILDVKVQTWTQRKAVGENFLGPGLLRCECGEKMYLKQGTSHGIGRGMKPDYYVCASKSNGRKASACQNLPAEKIEALIAWTATKYFVDESYIKNAIERNFSDDNRAEFEAEVERLTKTIVALERQRDRAMVKSLSDDGYDALVKKLKEDIRREQANLVKAKADLASQLTKPDIAMMATELRERYFTFTSADGWTQEDRKRVLSDTVEKITLKEDGSLEFIMKGGLLLQQLSDHDLLGLYFESTLDLLKHTDPAKKERMRGLVRNAVALVPDIPNPATLAGREIAQKKSSHLKGNKIAKSETLLAVAFLGTPPGIVDAPAERFNAISERSADPCWTESICTSKFPRCPIRNCGARTVARAPVRCADA
jgi:DNA invertase Pin-like site-specific DNA recombinase